MSIRTIVGPAPGPDPTVNRWLAVLSPPLHEQAGSTKRLQEIASLLALDPIPTNPTDLVAGMPLCSFPSGPRGPDIPEPINASKEFSKIGGSFSACHPLRFRFPHTRLQRAGNDGYAALSF
jgi:hypothetical protein